MGRPERDGSGSGNIGWTAESRMAASAREGGRGSVRPRRGREPGTKAGVNPTDGLSMHFASAVAAGMVRPGLSPLGHACQASAGAKSVQQL